MILFEKKYQTFDTVFHHQMKHLEVRQKLFSTLFSVFHLVMKHCISCLIYYVSYRIYRLLISYLICKQAQLNASKSVLFEQKKS